MKEDKGKFAITTGSWIRAALVVVVTYVLIFKLSNFLLVIITAVIIASAVEPAVRWAKKKGFPRLPAVLSVYVITAIAIAGLFYFILVPLLGETAGFVRTLPAYTGSVPDSTLVAGLPTQDAFSSISSQFSLSELSNYINSVVGSFSQGVFSSAAAVFGGMLSFMLIVVFSFYLAVQEDGVGKFLRVIVPIKNEKYAIDLWQRSQKKIGLWMQGQLLLAVIIMVLTYLGLLLIGLPHALLLAVLAGAFEIIPLFGPILSAIPSIFVAFAVGGPSLAIIVAGLYLIIQQFENHLIYPLVVKKVVGVPPTVSILALVVGGQLAGFLGLIVSVPLAAVLMEFLSDIERDKIAQTAEAEKTS